MEKDPKKQNSAKQTVLFLLLPLLALAIGIWFSRFGADQPNPPLKVGLVFNDPLSYCAFGLIESGAPNYEIHSFSSYEELFAAFNEASIDACLMHAKDLEKLNPNKARIEAVTSYLNLIAVENGKTIASLAELNGDVLLPDSLNGTAELLMLKKMLRALEIEPRLVFESEAGLLERAAGQEFGIMLVPPSMSAKVIMQNSAYRSAFSLAKQWQRLVSDTPPAGSVFVVREDAKIDNLRLKSCLASIERSISFMASKRKKAAMLIAANGFLEHSDYIRKTIPHCMFVYLEGKAMDRPLEQLGLLS